MPKIYRYYIGYMTIDTAEVGGVNATREAPIRSQDDVMEIQTALRASHPRLRFAFVTAFSLYADED